jgi:hypothetical protein
MNPSGTLATGTITMPPNPSDGMTITFSSSKQITALTLSGNTGQTIVGGVSYLPANTAVAYVYRSANTSWFPLQAVPLLGNVPLGVGQTTTNVTGSRANGVTYTNTTGRPITVYVSASSSSASGNVYVDGVTVFLSLCRSTYFNFVPICFIVPAGSTYSIANFDYYSYWVELR